jgi:hypothetical protein
MVRTLALAALLTLSGAVASQAQYQDSAPPDQQNTQQYSDQAPPPGYDEELLGPYQGQRHNDDQDYDNQGYAQPNTDVGMFASLGNDGRWFFTASFGWVWRPYAAAGWRPYSDGRWVWTSYGWTWVSYEPFGWATYHYGYWNCDSGLGWVWIPGYQWSACRAQFAYYDNYVCWAPLAPPGYACPRPFTTAGFNIWFTIGANHFCDPYPARYCVTPANKSVYTERVAYKSPGRGYVQQYMRAPIRQSTVNFKNTTFVRGTNGFGTVRSPGVVNSKQYSRSYPQQQQQPYVRNSRPYTQPQTRDSGRAYKNAPQQRPFVDARAMQQRQRDPGVTRQYQPSRESVRPLFEPRQNVARGNPSHDAQRSIEHAQKGHGQGHGEEVAKMKGHDNGRGNGKR